MKPLLCFAVVLLSFCDADVKVSSDLIKDESRREGHDTRYYNEQDDRRLYSDRDEIERNGREYNGDDDDFDEDNDYYNRRGLYVGNPDDFSRIERPCEIYDIYCIRRFFAEHAKCKIARGPVPDPLYRAQSTVYFARVNLTATQTNIRINGVNGRISEFYINKATDNLVIAIEFINLNITSQASYFEFFRNGMEPVTTVAFTTVNFPSTVITAVIPNIDDLQLDKAEITAFANDAFPPFYIEPTVVQSSDPQPARAFAEYMSGIPVDVQEFFLTEAPFYPPTYIQYNICDFGLKIF